VNLLIKQLLLLISITVCLTWVFTIYSIPIIIGAILSLIIQYSIYNGFLYIIDTYTALKTKQLEVKRLESIANQGTEIMCPCVHKSKEFVSIKFNKPNYYKCQQCRKMLVAFADVETAIVTEPIADTNSKMIDEMLNNKLNELT
jgi:hypothetical protein